MSRCSRCTFPYKKKRYETISDPHIKIDTSSGDMNEKVDHWLDFFEKFHKKYIIMPSESLSYPFLEESLFITVLSSPGFNNRETRQDII